MKWHHRFMMWMVTQAAKRKAATGDPEARAMADSYGTVVDFRDRSTIAPVVAHARDLTRHPA